MKVAFATLGCRVNIYESEAMAEKFKQDGYEVVSFDTKADVYVINTCTVTNMGDKKSRQHINKAKKKNKDSIVAVVGCYSQVSPDEVSMIEGVDVVLGTRNKGDVVYYVNRAREKRQQFVNVEEVLKNKKFEELKISEFQDKTRAFLKIQDGCNRFCSYCLIPYARGAVCSKKPQKVLEEVKELAKAGFKEIILTGIHIVSYGIDLENYNLVDLLEEIDKVSGIERIRIGSVEPMFFTGDVIDRLKKLKKFCNHFHLSLQSGCDDTLKRMNRRYTTKEYEKVCKEIRENLEGASITTDIIVGFPGETEEEFEITYNYLKELKLSKMHIFKYSQRDGTKAANLADDVHGSIKTKRSKILEILDKENESDFIEKYIGTKTSVLFEEKTQEDIYVGYTKNYIKVNALSKEDIRGEILKVELFENKNKFAMGKLI